MENCTSKRIRIVFEEGRPLARMKSEDVEVLITFEETPRESIKKTVVDILTNAYENRVTA